MSTSVTETGRELIAEWQTIDTCLASWILKVAAFDASEAWREDGFSTCASWLVVQCEMGLSTAKEKLRVAHELTRRPIVRAAFAAGTIPFTKVRELTRLDGLDDERDARFVILAGEEGVRVLEARVKNWNYFNRQDKKSRTLDDHFGLRYEPGFADGLGRLVIEAPNDFLERAVSVVDAYNDYLFNNPQPVDKARNEPSQTDPPGSRSLAARRAQAFFDLFEEIVLINADKIDPETATIGVTIAYQDLLAATGLASTEHGTVLTGEAVRRLACDAGVVRMIVRGVSEILDVGRKTRTWSTAQRRAIRARHGHRCAAEGCNRRITQIHHIEWWEHDGVTAIYNGIPLCSVHHHLVHEGNWTASYDNNTGIVRLEGPLGQVLETKPALLVAA
jgi:hypothetical protein